MQAIPHKKTPFKARDPHAYTLNPSHIDVWSFALDTPLPAPGFTTLSPEEQTRAKRFHFEHHRHRFAHARLMLRCILARYLNILPKDLKFDYAEHGKPFLPEHPELQFNLSHSGNRALLAVGKTHPLGIDLECFSGRPYEGISEHMFSPEENHALHTTPAHLKPMVFFMIWAQKEAFIKMLGLGLAYPTTRFTVPLALNTHGTVLDPVYQSNASLITFMPRLAYSAALCHHSSIEHISYTELGLELNLELKPKL